MVKAGPRALYLLRGGRPMLFRYRLQLGLPVSGAALFSGGLRT